MLIQLLWSSICARNVKWMAMLVVCVNAASAIPSLFAADETVSTATDSKKLAERETYSITVTGHALDADGKAIAGATVFLVAPPIETSDEFLLGKVTTDENGLYQFQNVLLPLHPTPFGEGHFQVFGIAPGRALAWSSMKRIYTKKAEFDAGPAFPPRRHDVYHAGDEIRFDINLPKPHLISGRFVDEQGKPIDGVQVRISTCGYLNATGEENDPNSREFASLFLAAQLIPDIFAATSDADGRFAFSSIPPEVSCGLGIEHADRGSLIIFTATTDNAPATTYDGHPLTKLPIELVLPPLKMIIIEFRGNDTGEAVADVVVNASEKGAILSGYHSSATSDADGRAQLKLPTGTYQMWALPQFGYFATSQELIIDQSSNAQPITFELPLGCVVRFKAIDAETGAGVAQATIFKAIEGQAAFKPWFFGNPQTNDQGELVATLEPGKGTFFISAPEGYDVANASDARPGRPLRLKAGDTLTVEFMLHRKQ